MIRTKREKVEDNNKKGSKYFDYSLLFACIIVILFGYVLLYSASSYSAVSEHGDSLYYLKRQILATAIGVAGFIVVMLIDYRLFRKWALYIYLFSLVTIVLVITPLGVEINGARRWVDFGFVQFQPAELVKISVILLTATLISKCKENSLKNPKVCWKIFAISGIAAILLLGITSNLSSAAIVLIIGLLMLVIAGAGSKFYKQLGIGALGASCVVLLATLIGGSSFRIARIVTWLNPEQYSDEGGYQIMQGLYAIGSGGFFGKGLGNSMQKLGTLPEATNDMIFSIICEELGLFGAVCIIALFIFMILRMKTIANHVPKQDLFASMVVIGIMIHISLQVFFNIAVVTNSMPNTGVSLPFISYGGTSLAFLITEMGLVFSISRSIGRER